jgi:hypothetical protein
MTLTTNGSPLLLSQQPAWQVMRRIQQLPSESTLSVGALFAKRA